MRQRILDQHHFTAVEGLPDLGIAVQVHREVAEHGILRGRGHRRPASTRLAEDDRAARDAKAGGHLAHQDLKQIARRQIGGHFLKQLYQGGLGPRFGPGLVEHPAGPQVGADPGQQLAHPHRLGDHIGGTEPEGLDRGVLRARAGDRENGQIGMVRIAAERLQRRPARRTGEGEVHHQQIHRPGGEVFLQRDRAGKAGRVVAVLGEQPAEGPGEGLVAVHDQQVRRVGGAHTTR
jgi:hypothetical protein